MRASDFHIVNHDKLDEILVRLCEMVIAGQQKDSAEYGMVAAAVLDPDQNCVAALNYHLGDRDVHGERAAIEAYNQRFGDIPEGSIILTTCSPCSEPMPDRVGDSCKDMISASPVHKVYAGYRDPSQQTQAGDKTYHLQITRNKKIQQLCKAFADTWLDDNESSIVDVDKIHAQALREHLLLNPALFENRDDFQNMRQFLNVHKTSTPIVKKSYVYASVQATPIVKYVNTAHFDSAHKLVKIDSNYAYFNVNGSIKRFPETGTLSGDSLTEIYFFNSVQELENFNSLLQLKFSDYKFASKILDQEQLDELSFMGSQCTKDCSGHRAGYAWSKARGGQNANSPFSPSFNKGSVLGTDEIAKAKQAKQSKPAPNPTRPIPGPTL